MARLERESGLELGDGVSHAVDARVDRPERVARIGPFRHLRGDDCELRRGAFQIAGFVQCVAELVVGAHVVGLQRDGARERLHRARVLLLPRAGDAEVQLCDRNRRLARGHLLEERHRAGELRVLDGDHRLVQRVRNGDPILRIDARSRRGGGARSAHVAKRRQSRGKIRIDA